MVRRTRDGIYAFTHIPVPLFPNGIIWFRMFSLQCTLSLFDFHPLPPSKYRQQIYKEINCRLVKVSAYAHAVCGIDKRDFHHYTCSLRTSLKHLQNLFSLLQNGYENLQVLRYL